MEEKTSSRFSQIDVLFRKYSERIFNYVRTRVNNTEDAQNIAQDVWIRVMESDMAICVETALSYLYKIASNLINDYLRRLYAKMAIDNEIYHEFEEAGTITPQNELEAVQLSELELKRIECLPQQRRIVYIMSRFEDKSVAEIADSLSLSFRTVENHLRMGRKDVRNFIISVA